MQTPGESVRNTELLTSLKQLIEAMKGDRP